MAGLLWAGFLTAFLLDVFLLDGFLLEGFLAGALILHLPALFIAAVHLAAVLQFPAFLMAEVQFCFNGHALPAGFACLPVTFRLMTPQRSRVACFVPDEDSV